MSTKVRRPLPAVAATPAKSKSSSSVAHKQAVLDNFDLEVAHRTSAMRAHLSSTLSAFASLVDAELLRVPRDMRALTLGELERAWAGSLGATARRLRQSAFEAAHPALDEDRVRIEAVVAGKRKRGAQTPLIESPGRSTKNARTLRPANAAAPPSAGPSSRARKAPPAGKRGKPSPAPAAAAAAPSPAYSSRSDHIFNPRLPATPKHPRAPRRNESMLSINGSPLALPSSPAAGEAGDGDGGDDSKEDEGEDGDEDEDELPDPAKLEAAAALAQSRGASAAPARAPPQPAGKRRKPSLMFRQSLAPGALPLAAALTGHGEGAGGVEGGVGGDGEDGDADGDGPVRLAEVALSDGRVVAFDPLRLSPGRLGAELDAGGLGAREKESVLRRVRDEAVRALSARMERWHV